MTLPLGRSLFYGVWSPGVLGHNLYLPDGTPHYLRKRLVTLPESLPVWKLDANFCRAPEYRVTGMKRFGLPRDPHPQEQSEGFLAHVEGWTLLAVWDRTGDSRPGSNAVFLAGAVLTLDELLAEAAGAFPEQLRRIHGTAPIRTRNEEWQLS